MSGQVFFDFFSKVAWSYYLFENVALFWGFFGFISVMASSTREGHFDLSMFSWHPRILFFESESRKSGMTSLAKEILTWNRSQYGVVCFAC